MSNSLRVDGNSHRVDGKGALIDRSKPVRFRLNGKEMQGFAGDTLASALLANDKHFVARSFKYHRPRGIVAAGVEEPNALFGTGEGPEFEPNQRGTMVEIFEGLTARTQNHFPSLEYDIGSLNAMIARQFPVFSAGFYYKTFLKPRFAWKHVFEPFIRQAAGLGKAPTEPDRARYEQVYAVVDVLIAGGGLAGIMAAKAAAAAGARVLLCEQGAHLGGRALVDEAVTKGEIDNRPAAAWLAAEIAALKAMPNVAIRMRTQVSQLEDHNYALLYERVSDHLSPAERQATTPRHRLWRVRAGRVVMATGAIERPIAFAYNDAPGVMLASAVRDYMELYGAKTGERVVLFTNNDDAYRTALCLRQAGVEVPAIVDARDGSNGDLPKQARAAGLTIRFGYGVAKAHGGKRVSGVDVAELKGDGLGVVERVDCDCLAVSGGWSPAVHLASHIGAKVRWDAEAAMFRPDHDRPARRHDGAVAVAPAGSADGLLSLADCLESGLAAGADAAALAGFEAAREPAPRVNAVREDAIRPLWATPANGKEAAGFKHFVDFQNDVTMGDVRLAAREGYESVEHAKRYTTLGMATDQGKTSNIIGLALLADERGVEIPSVGVTTFRPPYTPISFGAIAGAQAKTLFKPIRRTPMHGWHAVRKAASEPVGDWRRAYAYPQMLKDGSREDLPQAINREIATTRNAVSLLDASTLGKIIVKGPDAGKFLDRLYTNTISTLKPGRCRYALMCNDNGFLFDDGVIVRLDDGSTPGDQTFLCHTTSGGSDRVHAWMEEWLQTEWFDLKVYTANVTDQFAQIAIAGPKARDLVLALAGDALDLSGQALPFMSWTEATLAGCPARIFRISFSGELSYEIQTPANYGLTLWEALLEKGAPMDVEPIGTEALHVMRAEKGFIAIGDETDGTVTPHDLNMGWAVSKKKADFIGKRAMERPFLTDPDRKRLVGLLTEDPNEVLPTGAHAVETILRTQPMRTIGHVTSSYWSPTLGRSIAMALIERGPDRMGQSLAFPVAKNKILRATIVEPTFYDKDNERQKV